MKAVLHIGTPKTATTHLQSTLANNRKALAAAGIVYPGLLARANDHITLFCASNPHLHPFQSDYGITAREQIAPFRDRLCRQLVAETAAAPSALFVMSSENLSGNLLGAEAIGNLQTLLGKVFDDIQIVVYLRRQDEALLSMYSEFMRKGFSGWTFDQFIGQTQQNVDVVPYLDYWRLLQDWSAVFGQDHVHPRLFEPDHFTGGTLLSDFLSNQPVGRADLADGLHVEPSVNVSLSAPVLEFLRVIRPVVPFGFKGRANPERTALMPRINALPQLPRPLMSHAQAARVMTHYAPGNQHVAKTYFAGGAAPLFPQDVRSSDESNLGELSLAQFREYFHAVFD